MAGARQHLQAEELAQAEALYRQVLETLPQHREALLALAEVLARTGRVQASVQLLETAIESQPADVEAHCRLGLSLGLDGRLAEALASFQRAIRLQPAHETAHHLGIRMLGQLVMADPARFPPSPLHMLPAGSGAPLISVVMCSIDAQKFAAASANYRALLGGWRHEIIGIHDARSLCEGYNRGAARSAGDIIVFSHDDIEILSADFAAALTRSLREHAMIGVAGATHFPVEGFWGKAGWPYLRGQIAHHAPGDPHYVVDVFGVGGAMDPGIQVLDGVFLAVRREVLQAISFDETTFDGFHLYDIDFSYRAFRAGFSLAVSNEIALVHHSRGRFGDAWRRYAERFVAKHANNVAVPSVASCFWGRSAAYLETAEQVAAFMRATVRTAQVS